MRRIVIAGAWLLVASGCTRGQQADRGVAAADRPPEVAPGLQGDTVPPPVVSQTGLVSTGLTPTLRPGDTVATGVVSVVGAEPNAQVVLDAPGGASVALTGNLRAELGSLAGATVQVVGAVGTHAPRPPDRAVEVASYEIVSVAGARPMVGMLEERDGALWLRADRSYRLDGAPDRLRRSVGSRAWIVGHVADSVIHVASFGVIGGPRR